MTVASHKFTMRPDTVWLRFYLLLLVGGVVAFLAIQRVGITLVAPQVVEVKTTNEIAKNGGVDVVIHVLAILAAVIALGNLLSWGL